MLEINKKDFRYRNENDTTILAYQVIYHKMYFLKGNTKKYIEAKLKGKDYSLDQKYIDYLLGEGILIEKRGKKNEI